MIDVEKILVNLGVEYKSAGEMNFRATCINPDHDEKVPSMFIHKESCVIHCFGCGLTGNIFTLLRHFNLFGADAILYLQKFAREGHTAEEIKKALEDYVTSRKNGESTSKSTASDVELPPHRLIDSNHYLEKRGITSDEMKEWNMAVITHGKSLGWVLVPIYKNGILRNYFLRNTFGDGKLYGEYPRHDLLAGIDLASDTSAPLYLAEGIFDAIAIKRAGVQAVACLSNRLLKGQIEVLKQYKELVIVPDTDARGVDLVESAGVLIHNADIYVCNLPGHRKDADECTLEELNNAIKYNIPWNIYMIEKKLLTLYTD